MRRYFVPWIVCLVLFGCTQFTLVEAKRQAIGNAYSVAAQRPWNRLKEGNVELWTADGPGLESLRFYAGLKDGERLFKPRAGSSDEETLPKYRSDMTVTEIMEFVVDSLTRSGASQVEGHDLRPAAFGSAEGFRFELSFASATGLHYRGAALGAVVEDRLDLIIYSRTELYYFPRYRDDTERLFTSIQLI